MRKTFIILLLTHFLLLTAFSQTLSDLREAIDTANLEYVVEIKQDSFITLKKGAPFPDIFQRINDKGSIKTSYFNLKGDHKALYQRAEENLSNKNYETARTQFLTLLDSFPNETYLISRLALSYELDNKTTEALTWYHKIIDLNHVPFEAQKNIAKILAQEKTTQKTALDHIIKASIYNRNLPEIEQELQKIAQLNRSKYQGWEFEPKTILSLNQQKGKVEVSIEHKYWKNYALSQAAYLFEPNYKKAVIKRTEEALTITPYRESLMFLYKTIRKKRVKTPMLVALKKAVKMGFLEEFMIYEIFLPIDPYTLFILEDEHIERVSQYVKKVKLCLKN